jgi:hypothetical protein
MLPFQNDFSKWPPRDVYYMVLGSYPPAGVTDLKAAGRHYFIKRWVWISFHAPPKAIHALTSKGTASIVGGASFSASSRISANDRFDEADMRHVEWSRLLGISYSDEVSGGNIYHSWLFNYTLFVDRRTNTVFVKATGD